MNNRHLSMTNIIKIFLKMIQSKYTTTLYFGHDVATIIANYLIQYNRPYRYLVNTINEAHFDYNIIYHKLLYYKIPKIVYTKYIYNNPHIFPKLKYFDKDYTVAAINKSPSMIQYLDHNEQTKDIILYGLTKDIKLIRYVKQKYNINIDTIKKTNNYIDIINYYGFDNLNNGQIIKIIIDDPKIIQYMNTINKSSILNILNNLDENILIEIIKKWPYVIQYIDGDRQTENICINAIKINPYCLKYIVNQTWTMCNLAISLEPLSFIDVKYQTYDLCLKIVQINGLIIEHIKNQLEEFCMFAVTQNGLALKYIKNKTENMCYLAIIQNSDAIKYFDKVDNITLEIAKIYNPDIKYYKLHVMDVMHTIRFDAVR